MSAWYHLRAAISITDDPAVEEELTATAGLLSEALEDSRRAITGLRRAARRPGTQRCDHVGGRRHGDVRATVDVADCDLAPHVETAVFRIVQETLQNVAKHAEATRVAVALAHQGDAVVLTVTDDGIGFDPATAGSVTTFGLAGMHERAGLLGAKLIVRSADGEGTTITLRLPVDPASSLA